VGNGLVAILSCTTCPCSSYAGGLEYLYEACPIYSSNSIQKGVYHKAMAKFEKIVCVGGAGFLGSAIIRQFKPKEETARKRLA